MQDLNSSSLEEISVRDFVALISRTWRDQNELLEILSTSPTAKYFGLVLMSAVPLILVVVGLIAMEWTAWKRRRRNAIICGVIEQLNQVKTKMELALQQAEVNHSARIEVLQKRIKMFQDFNATRNSGNSILVCKGVKKTADILEKVAQTKVLKEGIAPEPSASHDLQKEPVDSTSRRSKITSILRKSASEAGKHVKWTEDVPTDDCDDSINRFSNRRSLSHYSSCQSFDNCDSDQRSRVLCSELQLRSAREAGKHVKWTEDVLTDDSEDSLDRLSHQHSLSRYSSCQSLNNAHHEHPRSRSQSELSKVKQRIRDLLTDEYDRLSSKSSRSSYLHSSQNLTSCRSSRSSSNMSSIPSSWRTMETGDSRETPFKAPSSSHLAPSGKEYNSSVSCQSCSYSSYENLTSQNHSSEGKSVTSSMSSLTPSIKSKPSRNTIYELGDECIYPESHSSDGESVTSSMSHLTPSIMSEPSTSNKSMYPESYSSEGKSFTSSLSPPTLSLKGKQSRNNKSMYPESHSSEGTSVTSSMSYLTPSIMSEPSRNIKSMYPESHSSEGKSFTSSVSPPTLSLKSKQSRNPKYSQTDCDNMQNLSCFVNKSNSPRSSMSSFELISSSESEESLPTSLESYCWELPILRSNSFESLNFSSSASSAKFHPASSMSPLKTASSGSDSSRMEIPVPGDNLSKSDSWELVNRGIEGDDTEGEDDAMSRS